MENKYVEMRCDLGTLRNENMALPAAFEVFPLGEADEEELYACYYAAFETGDAQFFFDQNEKERREFFDTLGLGQALKESASSALRKEGQLIGFTYTLAYGEANLHISCMCVLPEHKRMGLGKYMLLHAQKRAIEDGYRTITLGTDTLMGAFHLYAKNRFEVVE